MTYNGLNALRQHVTSDVRIHGIITHGGDAPNIVPEYAAAKFFFRAATAQRLEDVYRKACRIVEGAAAMTGAKGRLQPYQNRVENTVLVPGFDAVYQKNLEALGEKMDVPDANYSIGSTDVGNVSQVVPTIQPTLSITDVPTAGHTEAFKAAACAEKGLRAMVLGAKALAMTALDLLEQPELLKRIQAEHAQALARERQ